MIDPFVQSTGRGADGGRSTHVLRVPARAAWGGFVTSEVPLLLFTHWVDARSVVCLAHRGECDFCRQSLSRRLRGYISYYNLMVRRHHVLELTADVCTQLEVSGLTAPDGGLRGLWMELSREGQAERGRLQVTWAKDKRPAFKLPASLDVRTLVLKMYGLPC